MGDVPPEAASPARRREPWMLKKVTDEFAKPDDGDALVDECVTSVTTGRTMAEIASGADVWRSNRGGQKGGRAKQKAGAGAAAVPARRSWRRWSTVPAGTDWLHEYKYDGYRLLIATGERRGDRLDPQRQGLERQVPGARQGRGEPARRLPDRRRGGRARRRRASPSFQLLQSTLKGGGADLAFYAFDLLVDQRRGHHASCPTSSARSGSRRCSKACRRRSSTATMSSARARRCSTRSARRAAKGSSRRRPSAPYRGDAHPQLAQGQMHPAPGIRHRRLVGKRQAPRLPLAAARRPRGPQADLCRQGRHRLQRQADRGADGADGAARGRQGRRSRCRAPSAGRALDQAQAGRRDRLHRIHRATASCATRASSRCARTSRPRRWCAKCRKHLTKPRSEEGASEPTAESFGIKISNPDRVIYPERRPHQGRPRRLLRARSKR